VSKILRNKVERPTHRGGRLKVGWLTVNFKASIFLGLCYWQRFSIIRGLRSLTPIRFGDFRFCQSNLRHFPMEGRTIRVNDFKNVALRSGLVGFHSSGIRKLDLIGNFTIIIHIIFSGIFIGRETTTSLQITSYE